MCGLIWLSFGEDLCKYVFSEFKRWLLGRIGVRSPSQCCRLAQHGLVGDWERRYAQVLCCRAAAAPLTCVFRGIGKNYNAVKCFRPLCGKGCGWFTEKWLKIDCEWKSRFRNYLWMGGLTQLSSVSYIASTGICCKHFSCIGRDLTSSHEESGQAVQLEEAFKVVYMYIRFLILNICGFM